MSEPSVVAILDFQTWFNIDVNASGIFCPEDTKKCDGALNMLCARNISGNKDYTAWWGFEKCMMSNQSAIPSNAGKCAKQNKVDDHKLSECTSGALGQALLRQSAVEAKAVGVGWTPWFMLQDKLVMPTLAYLQDICKAYTAAGGSPLPAGCSKVSAAPLPAALQFV